MKNIIATIWSESFKVIRSKVFYLTFIFFSIMPIMYGLMGFIQNNPELAHNIGSIGAGVTLHGTANWISYLGNLNQGVAGAGIVGFAFVASWIFGREYSERTIKDLLALPVSRSSIVLAKLIVMFIWCFLLSLYMFAIGVIVGMVINFDGLSVRILIHCLNRFIVTAILAMIISTPAAFLANVTRGYLLPIGLTILTYAVLSMVNSNSLPIYRSPRVYQFDYYLLNRGIGITWNFFMVEIC
ncbi:ABC transporter permease [Clostridium estertheticum]|uniref:ABC transporter permease n=1 Tax=Clostridium estertheticum TaxID=238834 RepID=UPI001C0D72FF|nr:ABC transporter permease [Clostridium estertheticum]MBU3174126.1 ABC transporter permease [Clostridium estertheticum]